MKMKALKRLFRGSFDLTAQNYDQKMVSCVCLRGKEDESSHVVSC